MEKRKTIFDFIGQIFTVFGFSVICLMVFCRLFGEFAKGYSSMYDLGAEGITVSTLAQFLLTSTLIVTFRTIFFTDILIKNASSTLRTIGMFLSVIAMMVVFVIWFKWFPVNGVKPWALFFICFAISSLGGVVVASCKEKVENKKMQKALERLKEGKE